MARPTKYNKSYVEQAFRLCLLGATDQELADSFGVRVTTIDNWKKKHLEFLGALKEGKEEADAKVAQSLYKRALGYQALPEVKEELDADGNLKSSTQTIKHVGPDTTAAIFWLKNRKQGRWRDKQDLGITGEGLIFNMNFSGKDDG